MKRLIAAPLLTAASTPAFACAESISLSDTLNNPYAAENWLPWIIFASCALTAAWIILRRRRIQKLLMERQLAILKMTEESLRLQEKDSQTLKDILAALKK